MTDQSTPGTDAFRNLDPEKRDRIFNAATAEFASEGYSNASMNRIVKAAGISKGSLFVYFRTKRELFNGILEIAVSQVKDYLRLVRDGSTDMDLFERLETLMMAGFVFVDSHPMLTRIYFHLLQSGDAPLGTERLGSIQRLGEEFLADLIRQAEANGEIRPDMDPRRVGFLLNALYERLLRSYYTKRLDSGVGLYAAEPDELREWVKTVIDFVRSGISRNA